MHWSNAEYATYLQRRQTPADTAAHATTGGDLTEAALLAQIRGLAKEYGWLCYHTYSSQRSEEGFPDVVLTNGKRVIWAELKSRTGKLTEAQALWIALLQHAGQEVFIWRPADLPAIAALLSGKEAPC